MRFSYAVGTYSIQNPQFACFQYSPQEVKPEVLLGGS